MLEAQRREEERLREEARLRVLEFETARRREAERLRQEQLERAAAERRALEEEAAANEERLRVEREEEDRRREEEEQEEEQEEDVTMEDDVQTVIGAGSSAAMAAPTTTGTIPPSTDAGAGGSSVIEVLSSFNRNDVAVWLMERPFAEWGRDRMEVAVALVRHGRIRGDVAFFVETLRMEIGSDEQLRHSLPHPRVEDGVMKVSFDVGDRREKMWGAIVMCALARTAAHRKWCTQASWLNWAGDVVNRDGWASPRLTAWIAERGWITDVPDATEWEGEFKAGMTRSAMLTTAEYGE